jgi:signal transduction histidine kinase
MSGIASRLRNRWVEAGWGLFVVANAGLVILFPDRETIPVHLIWVSLALVYLLRTWPLRPTMTLVAGTLVVTSGLCIWTAWQFGAGINELAEGPLLAGMLAAIVWQTGRREVAVDQARRLAKAEREFVSDASHELRTPITVARGHAGLIGMAYAGQQAGEDAEVILGELECLSTISDRLLMLAAAEHPGFLRKARVDLGMLLVGMDARWTDEVRRDWSWRIDLPATLEADEDHLTRAFDALLENAAKFTDEGDTISVNARVEKGVALIDVEDGGIGIAPDDLPRVFDRFFRAGDRTRRNGGTGLGLAIVKAIVEAHDGTITVTSELGVGTAFRVCLPGVVQTTSVQLVDAPPDAVPATRAEAGVL